MTGSLGLVQNAAIRLARALRSDDRATIMSIADGLRVLQPLTGDKAAAEQAIRGAALVHHGGIGTAAQAMAAGVPQLIMALAHDQYDNAARVTRLGIGDWLTPTWFTGGRVAKRLARLLASADTRGACRQVAERLAPRDGLARTAAVVESWAQEKLGQVAGVSAS